MKITLIGRPYTKKNSPRIFTKPYPRMLPSKNFEDYQTRCLWQLKKYKKEKLDGKYNMKCLYYMPTKHVVDLVGLLQATDDILVEAGIIKDDNSRIIAGHDGSRVLYDKENPRVEIEIEELIDDYS